MCHPPPRHRLAFGSWFIGYYPRCFWSLNDEHLAFKEVVIEHHEFI
ncbi:hypothetical protein ACT691_06660 [Vibrio metschnikovii]